MILIALRTIMLDEKTFLPGNEFELTNLNEIARLINMVPPAAKYKLVIPSMEKSPEEQTVKDENTVRQEMTRKDVGADTLVQSEKNGGSDKTEEAKEDSSRNEIDEELDIDSESNISDSPVLTEPENTGTNHQGESDQSATSGVVCAAAQVESVLKIEGIVNDLCVILEKSGYDSIEKIKAAKFEDLVAVPGLGYKNAKKVFDKVQKL